MICVSICGVFEDSKSERERRKRLKSSLIATLKEDRGTTGGVDKLSNKIIILFVPASQMDLGSGITVFVNMTYDEAERTLKTQLAEKVLKSIEEYLPNETWAHKIKCGVTSFSDGCWAERLG